MLRGRGYLISAVLILLEIAIGKEIGLVLAGATVVYVLLIGEWWARRKSGAISCDEGSSVQDAKLQQCFLHVKNKANQRYRFLPNNVSLYILPDDKIQAYAFGWHSLGVTEGSLNLDQRTLEAILAHEYGHIVNGDSVLNMTLTAITVTALVLVAIGQFALVASIYIFAIIACLIGLFRFSFLSCFLTSKVAGLQKRLGEITQHILFQVCRAIVLAFGRRGELMADTFACSLGYGYYLRRFLERFDTDTPRRETLFAALYDTHPPRETRIQNINRYETNRRMQP